MNKNAAVIIGTGRYLLLAIRLISKMNLAYKDKDHPIDFHLFSDEDPEIKMPNLFFHKVEPMNWSDSTLYRFNAMSEVIRSGYDNILYIDADTNLHKDTELYFNDVFSADLFATEHFDLVTHHYEENQQSSAYISPEERRIYFHACLYGGKSEIISRLIDDATDKLRQDQKNNFLARAEDESYIQHFLNANQAQFSSLAYKVITGDKGVGFAGWGKLIDLKSQWPDEIYYAMLEQAKEFTNSFVNWDIENNLIKTL